MLGSTYIVAYVNDVNAENPLIVSLMLFLKFTTLFLDLLKFFDDFILGQIHTNFDSIELHVFLKEFFCLVCPFFGFRVYKRMWIIISFSNYTLLNKYEAFLFDSWEVSNANFRGLKHTRDYNLDVRVRAF